MKGNTLVILTGIGALSGITAFVAGIVDFALLATVLSAMFRLTWIYLLVDILTKQRMDSSTKVGWFAGVFLFGVLVAPFYWHWHIRDAQKWSALARSV